MGETANKDFSELRIYLVTARQGLLPYVRQRVQLLFVVGKLLSCQSFSHRQIMLDGVQKMSSISLYCLLVLFVLFTCSATP